MSQYISVKKKALKKEICEKIIDEIDNLERYESLFKQEKDYYNGTSINIYDQFWCKNLLINI